MPNFFQSTSPLLATGFNGALELDKYYGMPKKHFYFNLFIV